MDAATIVHTPTPATFTGLMGGAMPGTITGLTPHTWTADAAGLYHTSTDLQGEWKGIEAKMLAGQGGTLSAIQRLEGNAEAVFENTGLGKLDATTQARDREDLQRQFDAMAGALSKAGIDATKPLSVSSYLQMEHTLQADGVLEELGIQGHGLNKPPLARYNGYTNDMQNNVDNKTLYVGSGLDHGENAVAAFLDDVVLGHAPFPTVFINGKLEQLNQNGAAEDQIAKAVKAFDAAAFTKVYTATDFADHLPPPAPHKLPVHTPPHAPVKPVLPAPDPALTAGMQRAYDGSLVPTTLSSIDLPHTWVADSTGLYHTAADLKAEWTGYYKQMLAGHGSSLTAWQRIAGNAEAVFENTGLSKLDAATQARDREDIQRFLDAEAAAMSINARTLGIAANKPFTGQTYLALSHTIQTNTALEELALQGHGLNKPPAAKYRGYTEDIQNVVDNKTKFIGGGLDNNQGAVPNLMDDVILGHAAFPAVFINGKFQQLNQNGAAEDPVGKAFAGLNEAAFSRTFKAGDFKHA